uniref:Uncharacterized protein n=1 Tax=Onchocerca volvulus TaxID=6282 RepID=A0A8R1XSC7_ONCVO
MNDNLLDVYLLMKRIKYNIDGKRNEIGKQGGGIGGGGEEDRRSTVVRLELVAITTVAAACVFEVAAFCGLLEVRRRLTSKELSRTSPFLYETALLNIFLNFDQPNYSTFIHLFPVLFPFFFFYFVIFSLFLFKSFSF